MHTLRKLPMSAPKRPVITYPGIETIEPIPVCLPKQSQARMVILATTPRAKLLRQKILAFALAIQVIYTFSTFFRACGAL
jgi:hypothetical protein